MPLVCLFLVMLDIAANVAANLHYFVSIGILHVRALLQPLLPLLHFLVLLLKNLLKLLALVFISLRLRDGCLGHAIDISRGLHRQPLTKILKIRLLSLALPHQIPCNLSQIALIIILIQALLRNRSPNLPLRHILKINILLPTRLGCAPLAARSLTPRIPRHRPQLRHTAPPTPLPLLNLLESINKLIVV